jgi:hypothetical protein
MNINNLLTPATRPRACPPHHLGTSTMTRKRKRQAVRAAMPVTQAARLMHTVTLLLSVLCATAPSTVDRSMSVITYHVQPPPDAAVVRDDDEAAEADGSPARPFRSLTAARDAVRAVLSEFEARVTVVVGAGTYAEHLELTPADSGRARRPVVWRAAQDAPVLISGGLHVPAATFSPWTQGPAGAMRSNLTALGLNDLGALTPAVESGPVELGASSRGHGGGSTGTAELFFADEPMHMARWPNLFKNGSVQWAYTGSGFPHNCSTACTGFHWKTAPPNSAKWAAEIRTGQPYLHGYWMWDWRDVYMPLSGVDTAAGVVSGPAASLLPKVGKGARWHTVNMLCELDSPGEYFISRNGSDAGMLYFIPPASANQGALDSAFVSVAEHVVSMAAGTSFITLEGISFSHARDAIVTATGPVANITIRNCTVSNGGGGGISISGRGIAIEDSVVFGLAGTGVEIRGGHHTTLARGDNLVRGNHIHSYARWFRTYHPGVLWGGVGNWFQDNHIENAPHNAFLGGGNEATCTSGNPSWEAGDDAICGGNDNIFERNLIESVCYETDDSGAFYSCGQQGTSYVQRGNVIRNNTFKNVRMRDEINLGNPVISAICKPLTSPRASCACCL